MKKVNLRIVLLLLLSFLGFSCTLSTGARGTVSVALPDVNEVVKNVARGPQDPSGTFVPAAKVDEYRINIISLPSENIYKEIKLVNPSDNERVVVTEVPAGKYVIEIEGKNSFVGYYGYSEVTIKAGACTVSEVELFETGRFYSFNFIILKKPNLSLEALKYDPITSGSYTVYDEYGDEVYEFSNVPIDKSILDMSQPEITVSGLPKGSYKVDVNLECEKYNYKATFNITLEKDGIIVGNSDGDTLKFEPTTGIIELNAAATDGPTDDDLNKDNVEVGLYYGADYSSWYDTIPISKLPETLTKIEKQKYKIEFTHNTDSTGKVYKAMPNIIDFTNGSTVTCEISKCMPSGTIKLTSATMPATGNTMLLTLTDDDTNEVIVKKQFRDFPYEVTVPLNSDDRFVHIAVTNTNTSINSAETYDVCELAYANNNPVKLIKNEKVTEIEVTPIATINGYYVDSTVSADPQNSSLIAGTRFAPYKTIKGALDQIYNKFYDVNKSVAISPTVLIVNDINESGLILTDSGAAEDTSLGYDYDLTIKGVTDQSHPNKPVINGGENTVFTMSSSEQNYPNNTLHLENITISGGNASVSAIKVGENSNLYLDNDSFITGSVSTDGPGVETTSKDYSRVYIGGTAKLDNNRFIYLNDTNNRSRVDISSELTGEGISARIKVKKDRGEQVVNIEEGGQPDWLKNGYNKFDVISTVEGVSGKLAADGYYYINVTSLANQPLFAGINNLKINTSGDFSTLKGHLGSTDLTSLTIRLIAEPDVTEIPESSFEGITNIDQIQLPESITTIGKNAFRNCSVKSDFSTEYNPTKLTLPPNLTSIGDYAFAGTNVGELVIPATVNNIGIGAFYEMPELTKLDLSKVSITNFPHIMIAGCSKLATLTMPAKYTSIGNGFFNGCDYLIKNHLVSDVITKCGLKLIEKDNGSLTYGKGLDPDRFVLSGDGKTLLMCLDTNKKTDTPNSINQIPIEPLVTIVASYSFASCQCKKFFVPENVTVFEEDFSPNTKIEGIEFGLGQSKQWKGTSSEIPGEIFNIEVILGSDAAKFPSNLNKFTTVTSKDGTKTSKIRWERVPEQSQP